MVAVGRTSAFVVLLLYRGKFCGADIGVVCGENRVSLCIWFWKSYCFPYSAADVVPYYCAGSFVPSGSLDFEEVGTQTDDSI